MNNGCSKVGYVIIMLIFLSGVWSCLLYASAILPGDDNLVLIHNKIGFDRDTVEQLDKWEKYLLTYECFDIQTVYSVNNRESCIISATNPQLEEIWQLNITSGRFFSELEYTNGENVCVVDENAGWQLFGDGSLVGLEVEIYGEQFKIIGICNTGKPKRAMCTIYIPYSVLSEKSANTFIRNIIIDTETGAANSLTVKDEFLAFTRYSPEKLEFIDLGGYIRIIRSKPEIIIVLTGLVFTAIAAKIIISILSKIFEDFRGLMNKYYLWQAVGSAVTLNKKYLLKAGALFLAELLIIYFCGNIVSGNESFSGAAIGGVGIGYYLDERSFFGSIVRTGGLVTSLSSILIFALIVSLPVLVAMRPVKNKNPF